MAFNTRVFCRGSTAPPLSELLIYLRRHGVPAVIVGGASSADLLSPTWSETVLSYDEGAAPLTIFCHHAGDPAGSRRLRSEVEDFLGDLAELPASPARDRVATHLRAARIVVVVQFPEDGLPPEGYEANGWLMNLFVAQSDGLVQCDGVGFSDENDELILPLG